MSESTSLRSSLQGLLGHLSGEPSALLVLSDLLQQQGHPLGELISLQWSGADPARELVLLDELEPHLCGLVAPGATGAWMHRGQPCIAWYEAAELLGIEAAPFPLLTQVRVVVRGANLRRVVEHPALRNVEALTLVRRTSRGAGTPVAGLPPKLGALTLSHFEGTELAQLVAASAAPELMLVDCDAARAMDALRAAPWRSLELRGELVSERWAALNELAASRGLSPSGSATGGWFSARASPGPRLLDRDGTLAASDVGGALHLSGEPAATGADLEVADLRAFVRELRSQRTVGPPWARVLEAGFERAAPFVRHEDPPVAFVQQLLAVDPEGVDAERGLLTSLAALAEQLAAWAPETWPLCAELSRLIGIDGSGRARIAPVWRGRALHHASPLVDAALDMPPEGLHRPELLTAASAVFSLGSVLSSLLAGQPLWSRAAAHALVGWSLGGPQAAPRPPAPTLVRARAGVPRPLVELLTTMVALDPRERPPLAEVQSRLLDLARQAPADGSLAARARRVIDLGRQPVNLRRGWRAPRG